MTVAAPGNDPKSGLPAPRILVVDDDPASLRILERAVQLIGCDAICAKSAREAIDRLCQDGYSVMVLDGHLPDAPGVEVARFARASRRYAQIPIVAVSGDDRPEYVCDLLAAGADRFLSKPISVPELGTLIESLVLSSDI